MYEPLAKNSITERVPFDGNATKDQEVFEGLETVTVEAGRAPERRLDPSSARPDSSGWPSLLTLHAPRR
jgi:hypothetical protein